MIEKTVQWNESVKIMSAFAIYPRNSFGPASVTDMYLEFKILGWFKSILR